MRKRLATKARNMVLKRKIHNVKMHGKRLRGEELTSAQSFSARVGQVESSNRTKASRHMRARRAAMKVR